MDLIKEYFTTVVIIALIITLFSFTQDDKKGLARVMEIEGVEVYVLAAPLREYTVVESTSCMNSATASIHRRVECFVGTAKKKKVDFDAILVNESKGADLIKWK